MYARLAAIAYITRNARLFPMYFDHNATTPLPIAASMVDATEQLLGNPSSPHRIGERAEVALNAAREKLAASWIAVRSRSSGPLGRPESNNTVLHHLAQSLGNEAEIWISATEHPCVLAGARHYFPRNHRLIPARRSGLVDLDWLETNLPARRPVRSQSWRRTMRRASCSRGVRSFPMPAARGSAFLRWRAMDWQRARSRSRRMRLCQRVRAQIRRATRRRISQSCHAGDFIRSCAAADRKPAERAGTENVAGVLSMIAALEHREQSLAEHSIPEKIRLREEFETRLEEAVPGTEIVGRTLTGSGTPSRF